MTAQEISGLQGLFSAAIETTYDTRSPGGIDRCIDVLNSLKSTSLSVNDIRQLSKSIFQLDTLRTHKSPKIREVSQSLFDAWLATLYGEGRDQSCKSDLTLKPKKLVPTTGLKEEQRSLTTLEPREEIKKKKGFLGELKKETLLAKTERDIKDKDGKVTTKTLIPPPRRVASYKNLPAKDSGNPNSAAKTEEMVELFEAAKKAADMANAKGYHLGKAEASRCVEAISLLKKINAFPKPKEPRRMMERLERLTKHRDRTICNAALALLQLWRQRMSEQERKAVSAIDMILYNPRKAHQTCGQGFTRNFTKTTKLGM